MSAGWSHRLIIRTIREQDAERKRQRDDPDGAGYWARWRAEMERERERAEQMIARQMD